MGSTRAPNTPPLAKELVAVGGCWLLGKENYFMGVVVPDRLPLVGGPIPMQHLGLTNETQWVIIVISEGHEVGKEMFEESSGEVGQSSG